MDDSSDDDYQVFGGAESGESTHAVAIEPQSSSEELNRDHSSDHLPSDNQEHAPANRDPSVEILNDDSNGQQSIATGRQRRTRRQPQRLLDELMKQQQQKQQ